MDLAVGKFEHMVRNPVYANFAFMESIDTLVNRIAYLMKSFRLIHADQPTSQRCISNEDFLFMDAQFNAVLSHIYWVFKKVRNYEMLWHYVEPEICAKTMIKFYNDVATTVQWVRLLAVHEGLKPKFEPIIMRLNGVIDRLTATHDPHSVVVNDIQLANMLTNDATADTTSEIDDDWEMVDMSDVPAVRLSRMQRFIRCVFGKK